MVDLPAPLGPRKPVTVPGAHSKDTSSTAVWPRTAWSSWYGDHADQPAGADRSGASGQGRRLVAEGRNGSSTLVGCRARRVVVPFDHECVRSVAVAGRSDPAAGLPAEHARRRRLVPPHAARLVRRLGLFLLALGIVALLPASCEPDGLRRRGSRWRRHRARCAVDAGAVVPPPLAGRHHARVWCRSAVVSMTSAPAAIIMIFTVAVHRRCGISAPARGCSRRHHADLLRVAAGPGSVLRRGTS